MHQFPIFLFECHTWALHDYLIIFDKYVIQYPCMTILFIINDKYVMQYPGMTILS